MLDVIHDVLRENARSGILPAHVADVTPTADMTLSELGLDSLGKLTVLSEVCGRLGIAQLDVDLHEELSLGAFSRLLSIAASAPERDRAPMEERLR